MRLEVTSSADESCAAVAQHARAGALPYAVIALAGSLVILAIGARGDFPLSDDWAFAHAARSLAETGRIELLPWTGASVVLQAAYGALLTELFGFSFTVLRLSTIVIALSGVVALYLFLREAGARGATLALATAVIALSPLYVNLSFTFMTDVPFTALAVWAAYFYTRAFNRGDAGSSFFGSLCAAGALLVRQHGIFVAAAAVLAAMLARTPWRERIRAAALVGAAPAVAMTAYLAWLYLVAGATPAIGNKMQEAAGGTLLGTLNIAFRALEYLGVLLMPLALASAGTVRPKIFIPALAVLTGCAVFLYAREGALMFYLTNVMYDFGVGAPTLRDVLFLGFETPLHAGAWFGALLTVVSTVSAATLVSAWSQALPQRSDATRVFIALSFVLLFAGSLLHAQFYFDRYLLPILPFATALLVASGTVIRVGVGPWALAAALAWYAVAGTHDYMAAARARFDMLDALENEGVEARSVDGGMEYNAWRLAPGLGTWPTTEGVKPGQPTTRRSWWWVIDDTFVVSFRPLDGYAPKAQKTYRQWLIPGRGKVLLLQRTGARPVG